MAMTLVAAYDVSDDRRRARLAAILQTCGDRVQYSVFVLTIGDEELVELRQRATAVMDPEEDSLYFFRQCLHCWDTVEYFGQAAPPSQDLFWAAL